MACHKSNMCRVCAVCGTCISVRFLGYAGVWWGMVFGGIPTNSLPPEIVAQGLFYGGSPWRECRARTDGRWKQRDGRISLGLVLSLRPISTLMSCPSSILMSCPHVLPSSLALSVSTLRQHPRKAHGAHTCKAASSLRHTHTHTHTHNTHCCKLLRD